MERKREAGGGEMVSFSCEEREREGGGVGGGGSGGEER